MAPPRGRLAAALAAAAALALAASPLAAAHGGFALPMAPGCSAPLFDPGRRAFCWSAACPSIAAPDDCANSNFFDGITSDYRFCEWRDGGCAPLPTEEIVAMNNRADCANYAEVEREGESPEQICSGYSTCEWRDGECAASTSAEELRAMWDRDRCGFYASECECARGAPPDPYSWLRAGYGPGPYLQARYAACEWRDGVCAVVPPEEGSDSMTFPPKDTAETDTYNCGGGSEACCAEYDECEWRDGKCAPLSAEEVEVVRERESCGSRGEQICTWRSTCEWKDGECAPLPAEEVRAILRRERCGRYGSECECVRTRAPNHSHFEGGYAACEWRDGECAVAAPEEVSDSTTSLPTDAAEADMNNCGVFGEACCAEYNDECEWRDGECASLSAEEMIAIQNIERCGRYGSECECVRTGAPNHYHVQAGYAACEWRDGECAVAAPGELADSKTIPPKDTAEDDMNNCGAFGEACCAEYNDECKWREGECASLSTEEMQAQWYQARCDSRLSEDSCHPYYYYCRWRDGECAVHCGVTGSEGECAWLKDCEWRDGECFVKAEKQKMKKEKKEKKEKKKNKAKKNEAKKMKSKKEDSKCMPRPLTHTAGDIATTGYGCGDISDALCAEFDGCEWRDGECASISYEEPNVVRTQEYCGYFTRKDACTQVHGCEWSDSESVVKAEKKKQNKKTEKKKSKKKQKKKMSKKNKAKQKKGEKKAAKKAAKGGM